MSLKPASVHVDVNADGVVDHVEAIAGWVTPWYSESTVSMHVQKHIPKSLPRCLALVTTGIPPQSRLLNTTICPKARPGRPRNKYDLRFTESERDKVTVTRPAVIRRISNKRKSKRGGTLYDMVFATNTGHVTSIAPDGTRNWQTKTDSGWRDGYVDDESPEGEGAADLEIIKSAFFPTATAIEVRSDVDHEGHQNLLVIGETALSVVSPSGSIKATAELPDIPISPPIVGDFSGDGYTDVIIRTPRGLYGYVLRRRLATHLFTLLMGAVIVALAVALAFSSMQE
mmetsp:Transcript_1146/g.1924  ORF Transcript_1146/g.1924 Transcript_1146/m.1924 type:complete len:285 (-) Transcript_1146:125-979(-)